MLGVIVFVFGTTVTVNAYQSHPGSLRCADLYLMVWHCNSHLKIYKS